jgi:hypothetical protein
MTVKVLSVIAVVLAFRGSYLINTAKNTEEIDYGRAVSIYSCVLSIVALAMRVGYV